MLDDSLTRAESHETYSLVLDSQLFEILPQLRVYIYIYVCENGCSRWKEDRAAAVVGSRFQKRNRDAANFSPSYDIKF